MAFGRFLIFAAQIHQTGDSKLANELASSVFETLPEREAVLDAAINQLADALHENATRAFFKTGDWKTYHREMVSLVTKFSRGWDSHAAVALLLEPLSQRASGNPAPPLKLANVSIDPKTVESVKWMLQEKSTEESEPPIPPEVAARLADIPEEYHQQYLEQLTGGGGGALGSPENWLLMKPEELKEQAGLAAPSLQLGISALPVLAALVDDSYLTTLSNPRHSRGNNSYFSSYESSTERMLKVYAALNRPASRGDLAKYLLQATLPDPESELDSADSETLRILAVDFWKAHQDDTREGLALAFLREGSSSQQEMAVELLAASKNPSDLKAMETHILESPSPASQLSSVSKYIQLRKSAAKPFVDLYVKALREELGEGTNLEEVRGLPYEIRQMKSIGPLIKQLESQVSGKSPQARARDIAKEEPKVAIAAIPAFLESLSDAKPRTRFLALLAGAVAAEDPKVREAFINKSMNSGYGEDDEETSSEPDRTLPAGEAKAWKTLLADTRPYPSTTNRGEEATISGLAATALEFSVNPAAQGKFILATNVTGMAYEELALPRAMARLTGEPIPPLPDASKVPPARLKEIISTAGSKPPPEIHPYLKTLTDDERAAWLVWYEEPGETPIPESVRKLDFVLTERGKDHWILADTPGVADIDVGFEVTEGSLQSHIQHLATALDEHSRSVVIIGRATFPPGLQVLAKKFEFPQAQPQADEDRDPFAEDPNYYGSPKQVFSNVLNDFKTMEPGTKMVGAVHLSLSDNRNQIQRSWKINDGKAVLTESNKGSGDLKAAFAKLLADRELFHLQIQILSRADAELLADPE